MFDPRVAIAAACLMGAFACGWTVASWKHGAELANLKAAHLADTVTKKTEFIAQLAAVESARKTLADNLAASDLLHTTELKRAHDETKRLNDCVASGKCGLRVNATCGPATPGQLPGAAPGRSVDTATAVRLTPDAERYYFALRDALDGQKIQLGACVDALGRITGQASTP